MNAGVDMCVKTLAFGLKSWLIQVGAATLATVGDGTQTHEATVGDGKQAHVATVGDGKRAHERSCHNSLKKGERTREKRLRSQSPIGRTILQACWDGRLEQHLNGSQRPLK